ncbi:Crp/Fnr family transcriptional regulator [Shewanella acanthi]|uniref:Crp/Fnr family transcriptional regulator n=1 Tax=Shewanella acanthi TaxID=2864212 RepID=UPI001C661A81|nr:Crp/Fnr family transcriptional regulator [Shewanella acanthi]QYJ78385.1 Crp/Fnr family transcriptional regulator [Shewanella acanthi]
MENLQALLQKCPVLSGLPAEGIIEAASFARVRHFDAKEIIYSKGDAHSALLVIAKGAVRINSVSSLGKEVSLMILESYSWFGDNVFSPGTPRVFGATAHTDATLIELPGDKFRQLLGKYPESYPLVLDLLSRRLWAAMSVMEDDALRGIDARIARRLLLLAEHQHNAVDCAEQCVVRVTREQLANMMGLTRQSVHKVLKKLEKLGVISLQYGYIRILSSSGIKAQLKKLEQEC